jgi:hypothetical protein
MGRPAKSIPRIVVEACEIIKSADTSKCIGLGFQFATTPTCGRGRRLLCPRCGRRAFKLYRPIHLPVFAYRACHNLSYTSVQKHDARLDRLLTLPDRNPTPYHPRYEYDLETAGDPCWLHSAWHNPQILNWRHFPKR